MSKGRFRFIWPKSDLRSYSMVSRLNDQLGPIQISLIEFSQDEITYDDECKDLFPDEILKMKQLKLLSGLGASLRYRAGRVAARSALQCIGVKPSPIVHDSHGAPIFPPFISGSISHKNNLALSGVIKTNDFLPNTVMIGVDIEQLGGSGRSERFGQRILTGSFSNQCLFP
jgi:4'-phosphopantetheinyl transferase EntD